MTRSQDAFVAANRFGLGAGPGELAGIAGDLRGWLESQLDQPVTPPQPLNGLPSAASQVADFLRARRQQRDLEAMVREDFVQTYLEKRVFPDSAAVRPLDGSVRT